MKRLLLALLISSSLAGCSDYSFEDSKSQAPAPNSDPGVITQETLGLRYDIEFDPVRLTSLSPRISTANSNDDIYGGKPFVLGFATVDPIDTNPFSFQGHVLAIYSPKLITSNADSTQRCVRLGEQARLAGLGLRIRANVQIKMNQKLRPEDRLNVHMVTIQRLESCELKQVPIPPPKVTTLAFDHINDIRGPLEPPYPTFAAATYGEIEGHLFTGLPYVDNELAGLKDLYAIARFDMVGEKGRDCFAKAKRAKNSGGLFSISGIAQQLRSQPILYFAPCTDRYCPQEYRIYVFDSSATCNVEFPIVVPQ
ncbi:MAG: hypothetical protein IT289_11085 [Oligoflexia bacterium]|nr:hypothetical protein [Oligoflexia bacterium]